METHKDKRHTHAHMFPSCYQDILQLLGDWVICLCVCVLLRQLATAILQEWTLTFDSITADWIGSPPHCWTAAQHHSLQWHTQGRTLPIVTPSAFPLSIHVNICITYVFSSIAFFCSFSIPYRDYLFPPHWYIPPLHNLLSLTLSFSSYFPAYALAICSKVCRHPHIAPMCNWFFICGMLHSSPYRHFPQYFGRLAAVICSHH